eukprot:5662019-Prymnesium_polylepis.1
MENRRVDTEPDRAPGGDESQSAGAPSLMRQAVRVRYVRCHRSSNAGAVRTIDRTRDRANDSY